MISERTDQGADGGKTALTRVLYRLAYAGTSQVRPEDRHYHVAANVTGYLAAASSLGYAAAYAVQDYEVLKPLIYGNLLSAAITGTIALWHRFGRVVVGLILCATIFSTIFYFISHLGRGSGIQLNYLPTAAIAFLILGLKYKWLAVAIIVVGLILHLAGWFLYRVGGVGNALPADFLAQTYTFSAITMTAVVALVLFYVLSLLRREQARTDRLLLNILPSQIAERLKARPGHTIAKRHDTATVLFADLCGFTPLTANLAPEQLISLLDGLFSAFDTAARNNGVEKIKTIGDAYMAVAGVPEPIEDQPAAAARLALEMIAITGEVADRSGVELTLRIGIATGPLTAGIIGKSRFAYDVWGETVNRAARLEAAGRPGDIIVDQPTRAALPPKFNNIPLGEVDLKGMGPTAAWRMSRLDKEPGK